MAATLLSIIPKINFVLKLA